MRATRPPSPFRRSLANVLDSWGFAEPPRGRPGMAQLGARIAVDVEAVAMAVRAGMEHFARQASSSGRGDEEPTGAARARRSGAAEDAAAAPALPALVHVRASVLALRASLVDAKAWARFTKAGGPAVAAQASQPPQQHGHSHGGEPCHGHGGTGGGVQALPSRQPQSRAPQAASSQLDVGLHGPC